MIVPLTLDVITHDGRADEIIEMGLRYAEESSGEVLDPRIGVPEALRWIFIDPAGPAELLSKGLIHGWTVDES